MRPIICQPSEEIQSDARDRLLAQTLTKTLSACLCLAPGLCVLAPHLPPLSQQTPSCSDSGALPALWPLTHGLSGLVDSHGGILLASGAALANYWDAPAPQPHSLDAACRSQTWQR